MGSAEGVSDGRARLCRKAPRARYFHRSRYQGTRRRPQARRETGCKTRTGAARPRVKDARRLTYLARCRMTVRLLRSEEHTSELQSLMRISYAVFCLKKKKNKTTKNTQEIVQN